MYENGLQMRFESVVLITEKGLCVPPRRDSGQILVWFSP
jgi:hypothetical protein